MNTARLSLDNLERYGEYRATWFEDRVIVMMLNSPEVTAAFTAKPSWPTSCSNPDNR